MDQPKNPTKKCHSTNWSALKWLVPHVHSAYSYISFRYLIKYPRQTAHSYKLLCLFLLTPIFPPVSHLKTRGVRIDYVCIYYISFMLLTMFSIILAAAFPSLLCFIVAYKSHAIFRCSSVQNIIIFTFICMMHVWLSTLHTL